MEWWLGFRVYLGSLPYDLAPYVFTPMIPPRSETTGPFAD
jgi:hypothetical protein